MKARPLTKTAEITHIDILRRKRQEREAAAAKAAISADNRNLSSAW